MPGCPFACACADAGACVPAAPPPPLPLPSPPQPQLTWFTQPYVTRLRYERGTGSVEASTLTLLGRPRTDRFQLGEVQEAASMHPLTSFQARGRRYYVDAGGCGGGIATTAVLVCHVALRMQPGGKRCCRHMPPAPSHA